MKRMLALCGLTAAILMTSCDQDDDDNNVSAQDKSFVNELAISNRTEIIMGNLALAKATDDSIIDYAQMMVDEHTAAETELKTLAADLDIAVTTDSLDATNQAMRTMLMSLSGNSFDSAYIYGQVSGHQKTVIIVQTEIDGGTNSSLRNFATTMLPKIQTHLALADTISQRY